MSIGPGVNLAGGLMLGKAGCECPEICMIIPGYAGCTNWCVIDCNCGDNGTGGGPGDGGPGDGGGSCDVAVILGDTASSARMAAMGGISAAGAPGVLSDSGCTAFPTKGVTLGLAPGCVTPNTRIALFPDECIEAWELAVGDIVLSRTEAGEPVGEPVVGLRRSVQPCAALETADGRVLHCSLSHEIMVWSEGNGVKTTVADLQLSDRLMLHDGSPIAIRSITRDADREVIQISLSGPCHLYLSDGLWSHNKSIGFPTGPVGPGH